MPPPHLSAFPRAAASHATREHYQEPAGQLWGQLGLRVAAWGGNDRMGARGCRPVELQKARPPLSPRARLGAALKRPLSAAPLSGRKTPAETRHRRSPCPLGGLGPHRARWKARSGVLPGVAAAPGCRVILRLRAELRSADSEESGPGNATRSAANHGLSSCNLSAASQPAQTG